MFTEVSEQGFKVFLVDQRHLLDLFSNPKGNFQILNSHVVVCCNLCDLEYMFIVGQIVGLTYKYAWI